MATLQTKFQLPGYPDDAQAANGTMEISVRGRWVKAPALRVNGQNLVTTGKWIKMARLHDEEWLETEIDDPEDCVRELKARSDAPHPDIFCFSQKVPGTVPRYQYPMEMSSVAVAEITTFKNWWDRIPSNTRQNIKRSQKRGVVLKVKGFENDVIQGICDVQNETPVRQGRPYPHYGKPFEQVRRDHGAFVDRSDFICAYFEDEFIGFMKLVYRGDVASILQLNAKTAHYDKRPSNALFAKAVEMCEARGIGYLTYGKFNYGNNGHDSLCEFKMRHGFGEMQMPAYYVPLTAWGRLCVLLKLYRKPQSMIPVSVRAIARGMRAKWYSFTTPNTTVVDRRLAEESRVSGSGSAEREIDVVFAIGTSAVDAQRRAIHARKGE